MEFIYFCDIIIQVGSDSMNTPNYKLARKRTKNEVEIREFKIDGSIPSVTLSLNKESGVIYQLKFAIIQSIFKIIIYSMIGKKCYSVYFFTY